MTEWSQETSQKKRSKMIREFQPALLCVHFPDVDAAGHSQGWGSPAQLAQIAKSPQKTALLLLNRHGITQYVGVDLSKDEG